MRFISSREINKMLRAVIFDFDGILVNTEPIHYKAYQEILIHGRTVGYLSKEAPCAGMPLRYLKGI